MEFHHYGRIRNRILGMVTFVESALWSILQTVFKLTNKHLLQWFDEFIVLKIPRQLKYRGMGEIVAVFDNY